MTSENKYLDDAELSEEEVSLVEGFQHKIDLTDSGDILTYGVEAQKKIAAFSDTALAGVKTKDLGDVSSLITGLVKEIRGFSVEPDKKGLFSFLKRKSNVITELTAKYDTAENNVNKVVAALEGHQDTLTKDVVMLDEMYDANLNYFKELSMYIIAGKQKLEKEKAGTLAQLQQKAEQSGLAEDAQRASDYAALCERFEKRLADLEITRTVSIQMAPQIRLIQNSDNLLIEKIQSTINNTIPLWKNQMVLALGLAHSQQAVEAQHVVNETTNELIKKNAEKLHEGAVAIAEESERGIIDIETLKQSNEELLATLEDVLHIQEEGHRKRVEAEATLADIEDKLRTKLLDMTKTGENQSV